jgi:TRADD-N domain-containing protein
MLLDVESDMLVSMVPLVKGWLDRRSGLRAKFERTDEGIRARRSRLVWWIVAASVFVAGSVATLLGGLVFRWPTGVIVPSIGATLILSAAVALFGNLVYRSAFAAFIPQAALYAEMQREEEQEKLTRDITLPALLRYNREQMALYHQIATTQARVAGRYSQAAMAIGFLALIAGSIVAIMSPDVATKLITGGLAALGGIFSGYIARTFLVAQDKAIGQLYQYWEQPLMTSYVLMAERIVGTFADPRAKEKEFGKLVVEILLWLSYRGITLLEWLPPFSGSCATAAASSAPPAPGPRVSRCPCAHRPWPGALFVTHQ